MEYILQIILIILVVLFIFRRFVPPKGVEQIDTWELKKLLSSKKHQFIDVRTPHEFNTNRINQFRNIPINDIRQRIDELDKEKDVVLICQSGMRSNRAARILQRNNFTKLINVRGGMLQYRK